MMQTYDCQESELKLNDVFEFVGVLAFNSEGAAGEEDLGESSNGFFEDELVDLLPDKVLSLH